MKITRLQGRPLFLYYFGVTDKHIKCGNSANAEAVETIQKSLFQYIVSEKFVERAKNHPEDRPSFMSVQ